MRCLIYARTDEAGWLKDYFPDVDPFLLKIVNKPLLEYILDMVTLLGFNEVRIVSDNSTKEIEHSLGVGSKWGSKISYALARPGDSLKNVYLKNHSFCKDTALLLWDGFFFASYDSKHLVDYFKQDQGFCCGDSKLMIYLAAGENLGNAIVKQSTAPECLEIKNISSIKDYYQLSMDILKAWNRNYVLPGYTNEKDTFLGLNVVYPHSCELHPPIMIGNNCRFQRETWIGPNSIIGNNVIIDENTCVNDSIVYDNTYVGRDLDLDHKIVYKGNLISAQSGECIHILDKVLVSQVELGIVTSYLNRLVQRVFALCLFAIQTVPWLLLYLPFSVVSKELRTERLLSKNMNTRRYTDSRLVAKSWWGRLMIRFSLDKYDLLFRAAFSGELYLVGNRLFVNSVKNRKLIGDLPVYNPGVFSLSESVASHNPGVDSFYELEYIDKISTLLNIKILIATLYGRLFKGLDTDGHN